jgi:mono/diheme cytochrome c family protein
MMRLATVLLAAPAVLCAQDPLVRRGAEIFRTTCSVAYCHGAEGIAGRAPQLAGRAFNPRTLYGVILTGKPSAGMPGFSQQLKTEDIEAVTQYVLSLSGPAGVEAASPKPASTELTIQVQKGRALFFDALRMGGCGKCHEVDDHGSPVGPDLRALAPAQLRDLRAASRTRVVTASPVGEEPFAAIQVEQTPERIQVYDLTSPLPVLRTFQPAQVRITPGNAWSHATAVQRYSEADLEAISGYLMWLLRTQPPK